MNARCVRCSGFVLTLCFMAVLLSGCQTIVFPAAPVPFPTATEKLPAPKYGKAGQNIVPPTAPVEVQIQNALSAMPAALAEGATVLGFPVTDGGEMVLLKEGDNGWVCYPDWPPTDGNDPMCNDPMFDAWSAGVMTGELVNLDHLGLSYMLQGAVDFSLTDPTATQPDPEYGWLVTMPHVHLVLPGGYAPAVFSTVPNSGYPFMLWAGTPVEILHIPVELTPFEESDPKIRNAMRAAPLGLAQDATIVEHPPAGETQPVVLRQGNNGWTCWADWAATPTNDPMCLDETWMKWMDALSTGADFQADRLGIGYMLQGGSSASNTDPMAMAPATGEKWQIDPPHVMFLVPEDLDPANFSTDASSGGPYIMFEGTPYEHLMMPAQIGERSAVIDEAGPITATDPDQAQAEAEFRALVIAKEEAFYAGDFEKMITYYADDVISVQPGWPETVGKAALSEGLKPYMEGNQIVGTFILKKVWIDGNHATRFGEWEEVVTPKEGGASEYHIGRCILNWEKIDGEWKVVSEFVNYLVPPTEMAQ